MKKFGLGKGIESLIPAQGTIKGKETRENNLQEINSLPSASSAPLNISIDLIDLNPLQPRKHFSEEQLQQLADSIKTYGVIEPVIVQKKQDRFQLIAGERRFKAAKIAGKQEIPAIVKNSLSEKEIFELTLIENLQREDLNPIDEALAYKKLIEEFGYIQEDIAKVVHKSRAEIANTLRLLKLGNKVIQIVIDGKLTKGHARALVAITDEELQLKLAQKFAAENFSVRQTEEEIKKILENKKTKNSKTLTSEIKDIYLSDLQQKLQEFFGTKVQIAGTAKKGKIIIHYFSEDDLNRIAEISN